MNKFEEVPTLQGEQSEYKIAGNVFVLRKSLPTGGMKIAGHKHTYDHVTLLATGSVVMRRLGEMDGETFTAPKLIVTPAGIEHEFEALEPSILCCIHAIRDGDTEEAIAHASISTERAYELIAQHPFVDPETL